jgi:hypothetical protein
MDEFQITCLRKIEASIVLPALDYQFPHSEKSGWLQDVCVYPWEPDVAPSFKHI